MENKENEIKAVRLSDDELENVSGGYYAMFFTCADCGEVKDGWLGDTGSTIKTPSCPMFATIAL